MNLHPSGSIDLKLKQDIPFRITYNMLASKNVQKKLKLPSGNLQYVQNLQQQRAFMIKRLLICCHEAECDNCGPCHHQCVEVMMSQTL